MKLTFTSVALKTKHNQSDGYWEVELIQSKHKWQPLHFFEYSRHFAGWLSRKPNNDNICLLLECLEKVSQSLAEKIPSKTSPGSSTMRVHLFIPLNKLVILWELQWEIIRHFPHSPDLASSDFCFLI